MRKNRQPWWLLLGLPVLLAAACVHQPPELPCPRTDVPSGPNVACDPDIVYFDQSVLPILRSNCAKSGCHDATTAESDIVLDSYDHLMQGVEVNGCDPGKSELLEVLYATDDDRMPPAGQQPLTPAQLDLIERWIAQGALNLTCQNDCDTSVATFSARISPMIASNCQGCHSGTSPSGGILLTNYTEIAARANSGALMGALTGTGGYTPMPPSGPFDSCKIAKIDSWIQAGALNN